jgi:hypothetical protein
LAFFLKPVKKHNQIAVIEATEHAENITSISNSDLIERWMAD